MLSAVLSSWLNPLPFVISATTYATTMHRDNRFSPTSPRLPPPRTLAEQHLDEIKGNWRCVVYMMAIDAVPDSHRRPNAASTNSGYS